MDQWWYIHTRQAYPLVKSMIPRYRQNVEEFLMHMLNGSPRAEIPYSVGFYLDDIPEKVKLQGERRDQELPGAGGGWVDGMQMQGN